MKQKHIRRAASALLGIILSVSSVTASVTVNAAVLPDGYEADSKTYQEMGVLEDQYDLIEPMSNRFPIISPSSKFDKSYPPLFIGTYGEGEDYFSEQGMTDGLPVVPPTKIKAE